MASVNPVERLGDMTHVTPTALIAHETPGTGVEILSVIPSWSAVGRRQDRSCHNPRHGGAWCPGGNDGSEARTGVQRGSGARD